jgi:hypothetical protein
LVIAAGEVSKMPAQTYRSRTHHTEPANSRRWVVPGLPRLDAD